MLEKNEWQMNTQFSANKHKQITVSDAKEVELGSTEHEKAALSFFSHRSEFTDGTEHESGTSRKEK